MSQITSIAVDFRGNLFWSVDSDGQEDGAIFRARVDEPHSKTIQVVSQAVDEAHALCYKHNFLFFVGPADDTDSAASESESSAIYYKNMPRSGEVSDTTKLIASGFSNIVSISSLGGYIYVADNFKGLYSIEAFPEDEFSAPKPIVIESHDADVSMVAMVSFTLGAVW